MIKHSYWSKVTGLSDLISTVNHIVFTVLYLWKPVYHSVFLLLDSQATLVATHYNFRKLSRSVP